MLRVRESIQVDGSPDEVRAFVTAHAAELGDTLLDVEVAGDGAVLRTLPVHRQRVRQTVVVDGAGTEVVTVTDLFGFEIRYRYTFEPVGGSSTWVTLTKEAQATGWLRLLKPLIRHLLTRPEHDGGHLLGVKAAVEQRLSGPRPQRES